MNLPTISPSLPAFASTQPLLRCCLTSVQPLLDEKLYEKAFSFLPADGCWALRKEKLLRLQKPEDRALTLAAGLLARLAFLKMDVDFSLLSIEKNGKPAITHYRILKQYKEYTYIECQLETGRTHQIRVHMQYIEHPIAGDPKYGPRKTIQANGQLLHACALEFVHPTTKEKMRFEIGLEPTFERVLNELRKGEE